MYFFFCLLRSIPPKEIRVKYAVGIVTLFPSLKDPFSRKGCVSSLFYFLVGMHVVIISMPYNYHYFLVCLYISFINVKLSFM